MHDDMIMVLEKIKLKLTGHYNYYGVNGNYLDLLKYYKYVIYAYYNVIRRREQKHPIPYERFLAYWNCMEMPMPRICVNIW